MKKVMEDTDQEMSEEVDSDNEAWACLIPGPDERTEQCKLGKETLNLPELFLEKNHIFTSVLSMDTWDNVLSDENRSRLKALLPQFPENDEAEKRETVKRLMNGDNFKFGNPVSDLHRKLKEGYLNPEISKYRKQTRQFRYRDYKMKQQRHLSDLLKQLLLSRQELFEQAITLAPGEPFKFQYRKPLQKKVSQLDQVVKKKTIRILKEVRDECGVPDTSSDENEETSSPVQRSRRQLFKSLGPIPSPEPTLPSVLATYANKPPMMNGDAGFEKHVNNQSLVEPGTQTPNLNHNRRPRPISPVEVTEEGYKIMLKVHKRKKMLDPELPELDTTNITLQDILARCQANKKNSKVNVGDSTTGNPATLKKRMKMKAKGEKKRKLKAKESPGLEEDVVVPPLLPGSSLDLGPSLLERDEEMEEVSTKTVIGPATNFLCLLRDILAEFPDSKAPTGKLEERMREWLASNDEISNPWLALQKKWLDLVTSSLKFLSGNELGLSVENFIPIVDYKERAQQWKWIGHGRDSDPELTPLFRYWLQHKDDVCVDGNEQGQGSPPPPKAKTNFIVRPTSVNEKALFREQERRRFAAPHKAFTFMMHGYDSVVGPVKGVYDKDSGTNKAREHNLLISDRPPFVTILTLVRDAAARLPNGEGTRGDICELLKDSQFLAPGVTETQINAVVSGALDRLHSEKDPCVKYDVNRKLWIYLHRNRTEDEFERIHQAQGAAAKAKKTLQRPKSAKTPKETSQSATAAPSSSPSSIGSVSKLSTLPLPSAQTIAPTKPTFTLSPTPPMSLPDPLSPESTSLLAKPAKAATAANTTRLSTQLTTMASGLPLAPTVAQLRAAQIALGKSPQVATGKLQTMKQLTSGSGITTAGPVANVTTSVLTVTSVGLNVTSSLAAQLLYSPGLSQAGSGAGKLPKSGSVTLATPTTYNLVTTMNTTQAAVANQIRSSSISTISMLQNQHLLKQQQQQSGSQSVLKQNAALVAAVGQTVAANNSVTLGSGKTLPSGPKQNFTMTARQTPPPNVVVTKNQAAVSTSKSAPGLKQASLILSQDGIGNLSASPSTSAVLPQTGKLVALTSVAGSAGAEGAVMAQLVQQATVAQAGNTRGVRPQSIKLSGGSLVQPVIGGKPIQLAGQPFAQTKGGLMQLSGKGGQPLGLIRTPQGPLSAINLLPQTSVAGSKAATVVAVGSPSPAAILTSSANLAGTTATISTTVGGTASSQAAAHAAAAAVTSQAAAQAKVLNQSQAGIVVTQLAQGNIALRPGAPGAGQAKMISAGQASLVPTQFILQHASAVTPSQATQPTASQGVAAPLIVSNSSGVKGAQNLQVMRTVLSHHGNLKAGQATILISQPAIPQMATSTTVAVPQTTQILQAGSKPSGRGSPKGKGQPVYARIITPPPGMKLTNMAQVPVTATAGPGGVNVLQTMGKLLATSGIATHSLSNLPVVSLAVQPTVINPSSQISRAPSKEEVITVVSREQSSQDLVGDS